MKQLPILLLFLSPIFLAAQNAVFPDDYIGKWAGQLRIYNGEGLAQELPMQLHILPTDSTGRYSFTLIYGTDTLAGKRAYELVVLDQEKGLYLIDEKNTIRMEAYYLGGKLWQNFEVQGSVLNTMLWREGEELVWELSYGSSAPASTSGGQLHEGEEIPEVKAYPVNGVQRARLSRM
ncbi:MAG: hypothetical protein Kow0027_15090 [Saprospiraceae bacterium]